MKLNARLFWTVAAVGLALNLIDVATDGKLFGATGALKAINDPLPDIKVPGTEVLINLGGYLVIIGLAGVAWKRWA